MFFRREAPKGEVTKSIEQRPEVTSQIADSFHVGADYLSMLRRSSSGRGISPMLHFRLTQEHSDTFPIHLLLTNLVIKQAGSIEQQEQRLVNAQEIFCAAFNDTAHTPNPAFNLTAYNDINAVFFRSGEAFTTSGLATYFIANDEVQHFFGHTLESVRGKGNTVKIKELSAGQRPRWGLVAEAFHPDTKADVTLTDFDLSVLPSDETLKDLDISQIEFRKEVQDLKQPFPVLPSDERFDAFLVTYGFDSVWFPEDARYTKIDDQWYKSSYRIKLPENQDPEGNLMKAFRDPLHFEGKFSHEQLHDVVVEETVTPISLKDVPYGKEIAEYYNDVEVVQTNFPGGLLRVVTDAFSSQLTQDGIFIIGDVAKITHEGEKEVRSAAGQTSGLVEKYKVEDYGLAAHILQNQGYKVTVQNVRDYLGVPGSKEHEGQTVMIVKRHTV